MANYQTQFLIIILFASLTSILINTHHLVNEYGGIFESIGRLQKSLDELNGNAMHNCGLPDPATPPEPEIEYCFSYNKGVLEKLPVGSCFHGDKYSCHVSKDRQYDLPNQISCLDTGAKFGKCVCNHGYEGNLIDGCKCPDGKYQYFVSGDYKTVCLGKDECFEDWHCSDAKSCNNQNKDGFGKCA